MAWRSWMNNATRRGGCGVLAVALCALALAGCGDDDPADDHDADHEHEESAAIGDPSGAECPDDSDLTYDNFGQMFFEDFCTRCHSSELTGNARNGAPVGHDFDSLEGIRAVADHIDQFAAAGPDSVNVDMPPTNPKPSTEERELLGEWLACDAPE